MKTRFIKPAVCESVVLRTPRHECDMMEFTEPGSMVVNGQLYIVTILGYLPPVGEPIVDGYRLTKGNGESHDVCLVAGRLECTCGDWVWRRSFQQAGELADCKHTKAIARHLLPPVDQKPVAVYAASQGNDFDGP